MQLHHHDLTGTDELRQGCVAVKHFLHCQTAGVAHLVVRQVQVSDVAILLHHAADSHCSVLLQPIVLQIQASDFRVGLQGREICIIHIMPMHKFQL